MPSKNKTPKHIVVYGLIWKFMEQVGVRLVGFIVSIVLARLLSPYDFGVVAIVMVLITFAELLVDNGFGNSLIQKVTVDELDYSSVFYFTTALSIIMWALLYLAAPIMAGFYDNAQITPVLRLLSLRLLICGFNAVQKAYTGRNMLFKQFFWASSGGVIVSAVVAILMALNGRGVWALVYQYLIQSIVCTVILFFALKWRPKVSFSWERMKSMYSFGWKILLSSVITRVYDAFRSLIIGGIHSVEDLAFYNRGKSFPMLINSVLTATINKVLFPAISQKQESIGVVKDMTRTSVRATSYLVWPLMTGLAIVAEPLVMLLLTDVWLAAVPFLQITCFHFAILPAHEANMRAFEAIGRSDIALILTIVKTTIGVGILLLVMWHGVLAIALSAVLTSLVYIAINIVPNIKLLSYRFKEQLSDILPSVGLAALMAGSIYPIHFLRLSYVATLCLQAAAGLVVYILFSLIFRVSSFRLIMTTARQLLSRK